jgi:hypothetical protein
MSEIAVVDMLDTIVVMGCVVVTELDKTVAVARVLDLQVIVEH